MARWGGGCARETGWRSWTAPATLVSVFSYFEVIFWVGFLDACLLDDGFEWIRILLEREGIRLALDWACDIHEGGYTWVCSLLGACWKEKSGAAWGSCGHNLNAYDSASFSASLHCRMQRVSQGISVTILPSKVGYTGSPIPLGAITYDT